MRFGQLLKKARKSQTKTMREVASEAGLSVGYISDIEHGRRKPPAVEVVRKIERYLKVTNGTLVKAAGKEWDLPTEAKTILMKRPELSMALLRASENLSEDDLTKLIRELGKKN
jgi:transcriptional regulator with XRE-family HTH domain